MDLVHKQKRTISVRMLMNSCTASLLSNHRRVCEAVEDGKKFDISPDAGRPAESRNGKAAGKQGGNQDNFLFLRSPFFALFIRTTSRPTVQDAFAQLCPVGAGMLLAV
jgi:hypothetical protein